MMAPRWIVRLLGTVVAQDEKDDVIGDLEEIHGRRVQRWGRVAAAVVTALEGLALFGVHAGRLLLGAALGGPRWVSAVEVRLALRLARKQPVMTLTAVVALGLGIAIVAGAFSVFQQVMYSELPFSNGDRWVAIGTYSADSGRPASLDLERLRAFRTSAPALTYIAGSQPEAFNVRLANGEIERIPGARVTPGTFAFLPYAPLLGRLFVAADGAPDAERVALIRESLWERRFSRAADVLGKPLGIAGNPFIIVGVLPDEAEYPADGEIWIPLPEETFGATDDRAAVGSRIVGILAEGATADQATEQLQQISQRISVPGRGAEAMRHRVAPLSHIVLPPQAQTGIAVFMTVLLLVLLVIAANVANLIVARTSRRSGELAVRTALGASRSRIIGQLFVEVLVIGGLSSVLGLLGAYGILEVYDRVLDDLPFWIHFRLQPTTAVVVALLSLLVTGVIGVLPALRATRGSPGESLKSAGRRVSPSVGPLGRAMIATEVGLSVTLLGIAVLFAQGLRLYVTPEFRLPENRVLTARLYLPGGAATLVSSGSSSAGSDSTRQVMAGLQQSISAMPGVVAVAMASNLPRTSPTLEPMQLEGRAVLTPTPVVGVGPGLFSVLEIQPILGRTIEEGDLLPEAPPVAVVNEAFAQESFGTTQVLGRRLRLAPPAGQDAPNPWREIVGVVPNVMEVVGARRAAGVYLPLTPQRLLSLAVLVDGDPLAFVAPMRQAAYDLDPNLNIFDLVRLDDVGGENRTALAMMSTGLMGIGIVTLLLSLAGVYSIVSLTVTQRTREIGVRVALGATPMAVLWSVLRGLGLLVLLGAAVGALAGYQGSKVRLFVFAVPDAPWWLFPGLVALMGLAGLLACYVPSRRALGIQPVEALQSDS